jgi:hypothetical protein
MHADPKSLVSPETRPGLLGERRPVRKSPHVHPTKVPSKTLNVSTGRTEKKGLWALGEESPLRWEEGDVRWSRDLGSSSFRRSWDLVFPSKDRSFLRKPRPHAGPRSTMAAGPSKADTWPRPLDFETSTHVSRWLLSPQEVAESEARHAFGSEPLNVSRAKLLYTQYLSLRASRSRTASARAAACDRDRSCLFSALLSPVLVPAARQGFWRGMNEGVIKWEPPSPSMRRG